MRRILGILMGSALVLLAGESGETAVRELVSSYVAAREAMDARAVEALFTDDADQLVSTGEWRQGREAVVKGSMASSRTTGGRRTITVTRVRFLTADVAVADGRYTLTGLKDGARRDMWTTFVAVQRDGRWRIAAIRNMQPAAGVPSK